MMENEKTFKLSRDQNLLLIRMYQSKEFKNCLTTNEIVQLRIFANGRIGYNEGEQRALNELRYMWIQFLKDDGE